MAKKYEQIAQTLREELAANPGLRIPTEMAMADQFRCSRQTVRRALEVLVEEGLIQKRQGSGSYPVTGSAQSMQIAVISTFLDDYIFPRVLYDMRQVLLERGFVLVPFATRNQVHTEREILKKLLGMNVRGILAEGAKTALPNPNLELYRSLAARGAQIVFFQGGYPELGEFPLVQDDNTGGGFLLGQHLLRAGHRRIGGIFKFDDMQGPQRYLGLLGALGEQTEPEDRRMCWFGSREHGRILAGDVNVLQDFLDGPLADCTAVVCYNDEIAYHLIKLLLRTGRRVPEDVAVVSFDSSYYGQISPVSITSLQHPEDGVGTVAARQLLRLLHGKPAKSVKLPWVLQRRASG